MTRVLAVLVVVLGLTSAATARGMRWWGYADLTDGAELVVIAKPLRSKNTGAKAPLPDISDTDASGRTVPLLAGRVETELQVMAVLKGKPLDVKGKPAKTIILHHYRELRTGPIGNGPGLVVFDPTERKQFLMFLVRGKDGQYVAVSGQTDPVFSIEELKWRSR